MAGLASLVAIFQLNFGGTETNAKKNLSLSMKARASVVSEFETLTCPLRVRHSVLGTDLRMFMGQLTCLSLKIPVVPGIIGPLIYSL